MFLMNLTFCNRFELGLEKPDPRRAIQSAATIATAYIIGGIVPLSPYVFEPNASKALIMSVVATLTSLLFFGYVKGKLTGDRPFMSAIQTTLIGAIASAVAFGLAKSVQFL